jgi:NAD(P)-dependent dehydrogenase (short-subunit alcohol dehydrogenase family)
VADAVAGLGGLDILVNNAAHQVYHLTFDELDEDDLDRTIKTNLYAMNWITKDALPHLGPGSTIINSTSVQGYNPSPMIINYASTKFAIIVLDLGDRYDENGVRASAASYPAFWVGAVLLVLVQVAVLARAKYVRSRAAMAVALAALAFACWMVGRLATKW